MGEQDKWLVSTSELAEIMGITDRRIRQLEQSGIISKVGRGKYRLPDVFQQYVGWIKEQADSDDSLDLKKEKTLLTRVNRQKVELELQIMKGELHRSGDVERVMNDMLGAFRARCLAIPTRAAPRLLGRTELPMVQDVLKKEIYEALAELSDYDPEAFYRQSKDNLVLNDGDGGADEAPTVKENPRRGRQKKK